MKKTSYLLLCVVCFVVPIASPAGSNLDWNDDAHGGNDSAENELLHEDRWYWSTNGCTSAPDDVPGLLHFEHACDHQDGCYGNHWSTRKGCDDEFFDDMIASCNYDWDWWRRTRYRCWGSAAIYYTAVRHFGSDAWDDRQNYCRMNW